MKIFNALYEKRKQKYIYSVVNQEFLKKITWSQNSYIIIYHICTQNVLVKNHLNILFFNNTKNIYDI